MNLWQLSLSDLFRRPGRSLLTLLSIILGVSTVFAVSTTITGAREGYRRMMEALSGKADAQITALGGGRFPQELLADVEKSPLVALAVPFLSQDAVLRAGERRIQINGIGTDIEKEQKLHPFEIVSGRLPRSAGEDDDSYELILEASLAQSAGIKLDDTLKILARRLPYPNVRVVGLIRPADVSAITQGGLTYFALKDWQYLCKAEDKIDSLQIMLTKSADKGKELSTLSAVVPKELQLRWTNEDQTSSVTFIAFQYGLEATRSLALVVAALLIINTFQMNVTERRGQIAIFRLIGATRRQVINLFLREGAIVGFVGAILGLPIGWLLASWLSGGVENAFAVKLGNPVVEVTTAVFSFAMGPVVAVLAAFWPALRAGSIGPLVGLRERSSARTEKGGWWKIVLGMALLVLSLVGMVLSWAHIVPQDFALSVALFFLIGLFLMFPLVLRRAYLLVYYLLRFLGPMEFELACKQMVRTEGRALLTWGILFMAVATSVGTVLILTDVINDIRSDVRRTTQADFIVRVANLNLATGTSPPLPEGISAKVRQTQGVKSTENMVFVGMEIAPAGRVVGVVREFSLHDRPPLEVPEGNVTELNKQILEGGIVLSEILAYRLQKKPGDTVDVSFQGTTYSFPVVATTPFFLAGGMAFIIDRHVVEEKFGPMPTSAILIDAEAGQREAVGQRLQSFCQANGLLFQTYEEVQDRLDNILNTVVGSLWILLALGFLIAVFGVTNTLMMNILEQTREIGLMRVLGMQRRQIRRMILAQSAYIGLLAILPGLGTGVLLAFIIRSSSLAILGDNPHFGAVLPWLIPYAIGMLMLVLLFGWLPAARAARLNILDSIRSE
jgi:putative ABC transport system permease protein